MKKLWIVLISILGSLGSLGSLGASVHPFIGLGMGRASQSEVIYPSFIGSATFGLESRGIGAEFSFNHVNQVTRQSSYRDGSLTLMPLMVNLYAAAPISKRWRILAKGGAGYVLADRELTARQMQVESYPNYKASEEIKSGVGYQFGGGVQYRINNKVAISFEVAQFFFSSTIKHTHKDKNNLRDIEYVEEGAIDLGMVVGMIQIRRYW